MRTKRGTQGAFGGAECAPSVASTCVFNLLGRMPPPFSQMTHPIFICRILRTDTGVAYFLSASDVCWRFIIMVSGLVLECLVSGCAPALSPMTTAITWTRDIFIEFNEDKLI